MSKDDRLPIWLRPEPGERKPRFTRDKIAAVALAIADRAGFEAVSMREVAAKLGAGTMTLYHYVRTKDDLVALMDDALMAEVVVPVQELPVGWRGQLTAIARRTRSIYERHPWALIAMRGAQPGPNAMRHFEQCLAALAGTRLEAPAKLELLGIIDDFVFGHALRCGEVREHKRTDREVSAALIAFGKRQLESGEYPETAALWDLDRRRNSDHLAMFTGDEQRFERGLKALLDGAERDMKRAPKPAATKKPRRARA